MYENDVRYDPQPMAESEYRPKRSQMLKDYEINLRFLSVALTFSAFILACFVFMLLMQSI